MINFRKIFYYILIFLLILSLCGCNALEITTTISKKPTVSFSSSSKKSSSSALSSSSKKSSSKVSSSSSKDNGSPNPTISSSSAVSSSSIKESSTVSSSSDIKEPSSKPQPSSSLTSSEETNQSSTETSSVLSSSTQTSSEDTYSKIETTTPHNFVYSNGVADYGYYDIGNCKKLLGDVYTLVIFLDDDESSWNSSARNNFYKQRFEPSITFLKNQAVIRGVDLNLNYGKYSVTSDQTSQPHYDGIVSSSAENAIDNLDILNKTALSIGFTNKEVMNAYLKRYTGTNQIAYLLVLNKPGRAYAVVDTTYNNIDSIEFVVAFSSNEKGNTAIGSSVVHELLHLFGAADLYGHNEKYPDREKLCKELYPNDIMRKSATDPNTLSIGRLTECLIGWSDYFPPECDCKEWWNTTYEETHRPHASQNAGSN